MAACFHFGVVVLLLWAVAKSNSSTHQQIAAGVFSVECRDRYFRTAVDLSFTGPDSHFEAVDSTGVFPITEEYAAECGYTVSVLPLQNLVELRASYFSCHTNNEDDKVFTFSFNLIVTQNGTEVVYALNKTCSPSVPWSPREVTCELNYMEVSVKNDMTCGIRRDYWRAVVQSAQKSDDSSWQVEFKKTGQKNRMNLAEARNQGYVFYRTDGRIVFRTRFGQPDAFNTTVNDVPVEVIHATLFSKQSWIILMFDLVAACSIDEGSHGGGYMMWKTPEVLYPGHKVQQITVGLNGELLEPATAKQRGYIMENHNDTVHIGLPYKAEGVYRKSLVMGDLYEFYIFHLYLELISKDQDDAETRLRYHRTLVTAPMSRHVPTENRTVLDERAFTIYLGEVPDDVELAAVALNGHRFQGPFSNTSTYKVERVVNPDKTLGFTMKVPFDDPHVIQQFFKEAAVVQFKLDVNYTLTVVPENEPFHHLASFVASLTDYSPPAFEAVCSEFGIGFSLGHWLSDPRWEITVGSEPLTPEMAGRHGYIMSGSSRSLVLEVPLFTDGYQYKDITLNGFSGTFEILVRDPETSAVQGSTVKTCPFSSTELIACSTDGLMTVVVNMSTSAPSGGISKPHLLDKQCEAKETNDTRVLFSFPVNACGSIVKIENEDLTYENEIFNGNEDADSVVVRCTYPLSGLYQLFMTLKFKSDSPGFGSIARSSQPGAASLGVTHPAIKSPIWMTKTTLETTQTLKTTPMTLQTMSTTQTPTTHEEYAAAFHPPVSYIMVRPRMRTPHGWSRIG